MNQLLKEFDNRKFEVDCYYTFLEKATSKSYYLKNNRNNQLKLDNRLKKILKANAYLLLYNLIESTVDNSIDLICRQISNDNIKYDCLIEKIKELWIKTNFKSTKLGSIQEKIKSFIDNIFINNIKFDANHKVEYGNNINRNVLEKIAKDFDFNLKFAPSLKNGYKITEITEKRNMLAHGEVLFSECGQEITFKDLVIYKNNTYKILKEYLKTVEKYINKKMYLKQQILL